MTDKKVFDVKQMNVLALAYMGDAVLEVYVREHLLAGGAIKPNDLHHQAVRYVSAKAQATNVHHMFDENFLNEKEISVVKRGRNAKSPSIPKNTDVQTYRYGTAFEALIGYHHLNGDQKRVKEIIRFMFDTVENAGEKQ